MNYAQNLSIHNELKKRISANCVKIAYHSWLLYWVSMHVLYDWHGNVFTCVTKCFSSNLPLLHRKFLHEKFREVIYFRICWRESLIDIMYVSQGLLHLDSRIHYPLLLCGLVFHNFPMIDAKSPLIFVLQPAFQ